MYRKKEGGRSRPEVSPEKSLDRRIRTSLKNDVVPDAAVERVEAGAADQDVIAKPTEQDVGAVPTHQHVVAFAAVRLKDDADIEIGGIDHVIAAERVDDELVDADVEI